MRKPSSRRVAALAFTLIELLVVIGIVAVLAGIAYPVFQRVSQNSRSASCIANLRQLGAALNLYLGEHNMVMPTMEAGRADKADEHPTLDTVLAAQVQNPRVFLCPADNRGIGLKTGTSYFWNSALNGQNITSLTFFKQQDMTLIPILSDKEGFHPYEPQQVNILYADGHATRDLKFTTSSPSSK